MTEYDPFRQPSSGARKDSDVPVTEPMPTTPASFEPQSFEPQATPSWAPEGSAAATPAAPAYAAAPAPTAASSRAPGAASTYGQPSTAAPTGAPLAYGAGTPTYSYSQTTSPKPQYDGISIAAFVTGLLGFAVVSIALGAVGLRRTAEGVRRGTWMAVTGLILGVIATIAWSAAATAMIMGAAFVSGLETSDGESFTEQLEDSWDTYGAQNYGDDPELDALYDQCAAGDNVACDDLYWSSGAGSEYESFAQDCGGRGMPAGQFYCDPDSQW
ncbi:DUF4190 domain-containing protein [Demequina sp. NBRC 110051]|uniref:DUF4190 domain-containing protein n=1 Tax=Demequina sp. NBRC 110051 TaxID=1570340 RepID=UPI000A00A091|nr:DUF4190 domain-containing protein [Demequina sp. NBRC 110051]